MAPKSNFKQISKTIRKTLILSIILLLLFAVIISYPLIGQTEDDKFLRARPYHTEEEGVVIELYENL